MSEAFKALERVEERRVELLVASSARDDTRIEIKKRWLALETECHISDLETFFAAFR